MDELRDGTKVEDRAQRVVRSHHLTFARMTVATYAPLPAVAQKAGSGNEAAALPRCPYAAPTDTVLTNVVSTAAVANAVAATVIAQRTGDVVTAVAGAPRRGGVMDTVMQGAAAVMVVLWSRCSQRW